MIGIIIEVIFLYVVHLKYKQPISDACKFTLTSSTDMNKGTMI